MDDGACKSYDLQHAIEEQLRIFGSTNYVYKAVKLKPLLYLVTAVAMQEKILETAKTEFQCEYEM